MLNFTAIDL